MLASREIGTVLLDPPSGHHNRGLPGSLSVSHLHPGEVFEKDRVEGGEQPTGFGIGFDGVRECEISRTGTPSQEQHRTAHTQSPSPRATPRRVDRHHSELWTPVVLVSAVHGALQLQVRLPGLPGPLKQRSGGHKIRSLRKKSARHPRRRQPQVQTQSKGRKRRVRSPTLGTPVRLEATLDGRGPPRPRHPAPARI